MTDKPDGAALVEWLQTWSPVTENGQRAHLAADLIEAQASELTRLAAENRTYAEAHTFNSERFGEMLLRADRAEAELSEAKATIERLRALLEPFAESAAYYDVFGIYGGVPVRHLREARAALAALKPDAGEQLIAELHVSGTKEEWLAALAANREDAALKPDTGEQP